MFRERSEDAQRSLRGNAYCFMLAFLGMCDPLRTLRGNPRVCLCSASLTLSLFDRAHTRAESARSSTVMYASDAHADLPSRPHTSHMVACDVNEPRASSHSALPPEQPHAVCLANFAYDTPYDAQRVTRFNAPISQNSRHDMSERYDPRVVPHVVYPDQFSHLRQGPPPPRSLNQRVLESARTQAYAFAGP